MAILFRLHRFVPIIRYIISLHYVLYFSRVFKLREHSRFISVANDVSTKIGFDRCNFREYENQRRSQNFD